MSMVREFLSTYTVTVRTFRGREDSNFAELKDDDNDAFDILSEFIASLEADDTTDKVNKTTIGAKQVKREPSKRHIFGMLSSGPYGEKGELKNVLTNETKPITEVHAAAYPYYFNFYLPNEGAQGLFALHSRGKFGCKTPFQNALRIFMEKHYPKLRIYLHPLEVDFKENFSYFKPFGVQVRKIEAFENKPLRVPDATLRGVRRGEEKVHIHRVVSLGRSEGSLFDPVNLLEPTLASRTTKREFKRYVRLGDQADEVNYKITVRLGGQEKTMELNQALDFHLSFDLSEDLKGYSRTVATITKLHEVCAEYIQHAIKELE